VSFLAQELLAFLVFFQDVLQICESSNNNEKTIKQTFWFILQQKNKTIKLFKTF